MAKRQYKGRQLLEWITGNADRPLTIEEMSQAVGWDKQSCSTAASRFVGEYPQMRRTNRGTYVWDSAPVDAVEAEPVKELFLRVIKHRGADGAMLAEDVEHTDQLYIVTPFEF